MWVQDPYDECDHCVCQDVSMELTGKNDIEEILQRTGFWVDLSKYKHRHLS